MAPFDTLTNVFCKLSGMVTEAKKDWRVGDLAPYVRYVLEWFGPDRCVFGSDWPVCLLAGSYGQVIDACRQALGDVSRADRERIFGGNAIQLYRLPVPAAAARTS
jgi:L-fuconolactonase